MEFIDRLRLAASQAGVGFTQQEIAESLGIDRRVVHQWFKRGSLPSTETMLRIGELWKVDPHWLATDQGSMVLEPAGRELSKDERYIVRQFRSAEPKAKRMLLTMARALGKVAVVLVVAIPPHPAEAFNNKNLVEPLFLQVIERVTHCLRFVLRILMGERLQFRPSR